MARLLPGNPLLLQHHDWPILSPGCSAAPPAFCTSCAPVHTASGRVNVQLCNMSPNSSEVIVRIYLPTRKRRSYRPNLVHHVAGSRLHLRRSHGCSSFVPHVLSAVCLPSSERCLPMAFSHFAIELYVLFLLVRQNSLHMLDPNSLSIICLENITQSIACFLLSLIGLLIDRILNFNIFKLI